MYTDSSDEEEREVIWEVKQIKRKDFNFSTMEAVDQKGILLDKQPRNSANN